MQVRKLDFVMKYITAHLHKFFLYEIYFQFSTRKLLYKLLALTQPFSSSCCSLNAVRSGPSEPARWSLYKRTPSAKSHPPQDSRDGPSRDTAVRHLPTAAGVARMRVQNSMQVPGNRIHSARCYWWQQTQGRTSPRPFHAIGQKCIIEFIRKFIPILHLNMEFCK